MRSHTRQAFLDQHQVRRWLTGLVNRPELNGVRGRVVRYIPGKDLWEVELKNGHGRSSLKAENMRVVV